MTQGDIKEEIGKQLNEKIQACKRLTYNIEQLSQELQEAKSEKQKVEDALRLAREE